MMNILEAIKNTWPAYKEVSAGEGGSTRAFARTAEKTNGSPSCQSKIILPAVVVKKAGGSIFFLMDHNNKTNRETCDRLCNHSGINFKSSNLAIIVSLGDHAPSSPATAKKSGSDALQCIQVHCVKSQYADNDSATDYKNNLSWQQARKTNERNNNYE